MKVHRIAGVDVLDATDEAAGREIEPREPEAHGVATRAPDHRGEQCLAPLLEHDRRRNTALTETLEQYLARRRSVVETARALYIHPNTLRQRLGRIERVAEWDINAEDLLALELAVKLVRLHEARAQIRVGR